MPSLMLGLFKRNETLESLILIGVVLAEMRLNRIESSGVGFQIFSLGAVAFFVVRVLVTISNVELGDVNTLGSIAVASSVFLSVIGLLQAICSVVNMKSDRGKLFYSKEGKRLIAGGYATIVAAIFLLVQTSKIIKTKNTIERRDFMNGLLMMVAATVYFFLADDIDQEQLSSIIICLALVVALLLLVSSNNKEENKVPNKGILSYLMASYIGWFIASALGIQVMGDKVKMVEKLVAIFTMFDKAISILLSK
ncbi:hypothetical protein EROM_090030 [Encephalitozoon romaleae SJ-2008]|uniref:Uncharacterized protein n=1 Tax=Encephalitozoon romaleae (strain SJ-2008) TaxID=1178016 RepID=I6ZV47_ENCRO|nr:hypothetical protein EROM_090030 [Encephalitozoon romaleae SJ-2008]AFN83621.1 hypothetical protein EROM_090030 [Encephalitozoon romaleae SJ-2008]